MWIIPEHGLLVALIENAVKDACLKDKPYVQSPRRDALEWLFGWNSSDSALSFTFPWTCWHLDLDPDTVSDRLKHYVLEHGEDETKSSNFECFYSWLRLDNNPITSSLKI